MQDIIDALCIGDVDSALCSPPIGGSNYVSVVSDTISVEKIGIIVDNYPKYANINREGSGK